MRKFRLMNNLGEWLELSKSLQTIFIHTVDGLGASYNREYLKAGHEWIETKKETEQTKISGLLEFRGYSEYTKFVNFCSFEPLTLEYLPQKEPFCKEINLTSIEKKDGEFSFNVSFSPLTPWYQKSQSEETSVNGAKQKTYAYTYPYTYSQGSAGTVKITNTGTLTSPALIMIQGPVTSPQWTHSYKGKSIASGRINGVIAIGEILIIDADPSSMRIEVVNAKFELLRDMYGNSDFGTARFLYLPIGENVISFSHTGTSEIKAFIEVKSLNDTV